MKILICLSILFCSISSQAGHQVKGQTYSIETPQKKLIYKKRYERLFSEHFLKIRLHEQANQVVCMAIKFTYNAALGVHNVFQMKSLCRAYDQDSKVYALFTTFKQKEINYWTRFPEFDAYSYEQGTEQYDFSN